MTRNKKIIFSILFTCLFLCSCEINSPKNSFNKFLFFWSEYKEMKENSPQNTEELILKEKQVKDTFYEFYDSKIYENYKSLYSDSVNNYFFDSIEKINLAIQKNNYLEIDDYIIQVIQLERLSYNKTTSFYYILIIALFCLVTVIFVLLYITMNKYERELQNSEEINIYSKFLIEGIESERKRISKELHDTVLQDIKSLSIECNLLNNLEGQNLKHRDNILKISDSSMKNLRHICNNLTPPELAENFNPLSAFSMSNSTGLVTALNNLTTQFTEKTGIPCFTKIQDNFIAEKLSINVTNNIFRICQEAFCNIEKHAKANQTSLMLLMGKKNNSIIIYINDDGCGYDPNKIDKFSPHFGIRNLHERTKLIHGNIQIQTALGEGTEIRLEVPFSN